MRKLTRTQKEPWFVNVSNDNARVVDLREIGARLLKAHDEGRTHDAAQAIIDLRRALALWSTDNCNNS